MPNTMSSAGGNKEMQHLDVTKTEAAWSSLAGNVYVPPTAEEDAQQFFVTLSTQADDLNAKINAYADRIGRITKQSTPAEFEAIISASANDLQLFAQRIETLFPKYRSNI